MTFVAAGFEEYPTVYGSDPGPPSVSCAVSPAGVDADNPETHVRGTKTLAGNTTLTPLSIPPWVESNRMDGELACEYSIQTGGSGQDILSNPDTYDNVKARLAAARASGHAYRNAGITSGNIATFSDGNYPQLKYYNFQHGSYQSFHGTWRRACEGDPGGEGTVGFSLDPNVFDHGLDMATNEYFNNPNNVYQQLVSYAKRFENEVGEFEGVFSLYDNRSAPPPATLKFDRVRMPMWGKLQKSSVCSIPSSEGVGTTFAVTRDLLASEELIFPVDKHGSMDFYSSSWSSVGIKERQFSSDIPDVDGSAFVISSFCQLHLAYLWYPVECVVAYDKVTVNYKDGYDTSDGSGKPLVEQLASPVVVERMGVNVDVPFNGGFISDEALTGILTNNCQKVAIKPVSIALASNGEGSLGSLKVLSKQRKGNLGFPQLDHMKDSVVWSMTGGGSKVFKGVRKNTKWYRKLLWTYTKTIISASSASCNPITCRLLGGSPLGFSTFIEVEKEADPSVVYDGWTSETAKKFFTSHNWKYVAAESSQGGTEISAPTDEHYEHPPVWGCVGYDSATATTAERGIEWTDSSVYVASLTSSAIPTRALFGAEREQQDFGSNYFLENQIPEVDRIDIYDYQGDGCGLENPPCYGNYSFPCFTEPYSEFNHRAGGKVVDPYYGYAPTAQSVPVTLELTVADQGFYGVELPEILENGVPTGTYDTTQLAPGERADVNGRVYSPIVRSSQIYAASAPPTGFYDVIRNTRIV